jgi:signal transduction histidine kinase
MRTLARPLATVAALLLLLTFLVLRGTAPDPFPQEQQLNLVDAIVLDQAALERDALRARAGLLANYDRLVDTVARLREDARRLQAVPADRPEVARRVADLRDAIRDQELLIDTIKTSNALIENSVAYFAYLVRREADDRGGLDIDLANLTTDVLRFTRSVDHRSSDELAHELARLDPRIDGGETPSRKSIITYAGMIIDLAPTLDSSLALLISSSVEPDAALLRSALTETYQRQQRKATVYHALLYIAGTLLLFYLLFLYLKLRHNVIALGQHTATLETRSAYQSVLGELSTSFIGMPPERTDRGIEEGLAKLGRQFQADRAYLVIAAQGEDAARTLAWSTGDWHGTPDWPLGALELLQTPAIAGLERDGCVAVRPADDLPPGEARATLEAQGVRAWLGIPLGQTEHRAGLLGLEVARAPRDWQADSLQYLRIAGDIFAHVLERQRAEAEREALTARLAQAERMQAIGTLAGGIAHNFNNILGAILGYAEMALAGLPEGSRTRRHLEEVRKAGTRAKLLVDQILTFGRRTEPSRTPVRIALLLDETTRLLSAVLPATVTIETELLDEDATVVGDPAQLQQIVMNLCTNAAQAMNGVGRIELTASAVEYREERVLSHGRVAGGRYLRLAVADQGHGMDRATLARLFEPFFTTKPAGRGTGLGLATVHGIVADHGGALDVSSLPGERTVFDVYLPAAEPAAVTPSAAASRPRPAAPGAGQTILLVDDEETLVLLGEEMLAALGYEPVGVTGPSRALELFEADPTRFDLVLSDEVMPGMTGSQLAARLAEARPDLPILLMTGYGGRIAGERLRAAGVREVLRKPLMPSELAAALRRQLAPGG